MLNKTPYTTHTYREIINKSFSLHDDLHTTMELIDSSPHGTPSCTLLRPMRKSHFSNKHIISIKK